MGVIALLHERSMEFLLSGATGEIVLVPNGGMREWLDWHFCCRHFCHFCTAIVVAIVVAVVLRSSLLSSHACECCMGELWDCFQQVLFKR